jgi:hypothetical protein
MRNQLCFEVIGKGDERFDIFSNDPIPQIVGKQRMCGRYYSLLDKQQVAESIFHVRGNLKNSFFLVQTTNVTPDSMRPVICHNRETGERELLMMRWGIVPWFAES